MSTYEDAGVNIQLGDKSSRIAYKCAKATFLARKGMFGEPIAQDGGFAGMLDFGDFCLVMGDDGVGTKMEIAINVEKFNTLGEDLLAMVVDDAICIGAEVIAITNTIDVNKVNSQQIKPLMEGLKKACIDQKISIAGGEIAELGDSVKNMVWNATAVGIVKKEQVIKGNNIQVGNKIIALKSNLFRSNGFSLIRYILQKQFGEDWYSAKYDDDKTWGEITLIPAKIYHLAILELVGRFGKTGQVDVKGIAHITGGGIPGNLNRILKINKLGADLSDLWEPQAPMLKLQEIGNVDDVEAYKTWNMGTGMMVIVDENNVPKTLEILSHNNVQAKVCGEVIADSKIHIKNKGYFQKEDFLTFDI